MSRFITLLFLISLFSIFLPPPTDPDLGWHLRCGQEIWQGRGFCSQNRFTVLLENYSWPNHAWGYQAIIYPIWSAFGGWGLTIFNALLITTAFGFLYFAIKNRTLEKMLAILATIYFGWGVFSFGIRSQLVGFFFFNLTLYLLTRIQEKPKLAFLLPLVTLIWANTHGSVILGLILIFSYLIGQAIACRIRHIKIFKIPTPLLISPLLATGVTLINPFGFRIYEEMWRHFSGPIDLSKLIAEWVPPVPMVQQIIITTGTAAFLYLPFKLFCNSELQFALPTLFLIPIFTFWGLKARRNVPFYFVVLSYSLLNSLRTKISPLRDQLAGLLSVGVLLYGLIVQLPQTIETNSSWQNYCQNKSLTLPCKAVEFLKAQEDRGNIFNRYEWGGFLIWQLPEYKIFVDGRMPSWLGPENKSPYTIYLHTLQTRQAGGQAQPGWQDTLDQYDITYILISPNTFMDLLLAPDPARFGWREVYRDKGSVIYKRLKKPIPPA